MEIKTGFKLGVKSLDKAFYIMQDIREATRGTVEHEAAKILAEVACYRYDDVTISGEKTGKSALVTVRDTINVILNNAAAQQLETSYNLGFSVALGITSNKTVIGIAFTGNRRLYDVLMTHPDVRDYSYWETFERPENVSNRVWATRRGHWNEVLRDEDPMAEMFNMTFVPPYTMPYPSKETVTEQLITFEKRLHRAAEQTTMSKAITELGLDSQFKRLQYRMGQAEHYTARFEAEKVILAEKLKQNLTIEDLLEKI